MSHAEGKAILPDGTQYWFEYNGTADVCCTRLYKTMKELNENWRLNNFTECICKENEKKFKNVILSTMYGGWHFLFYSTICEKCLCITGKIDYNEY